METFARDLQDSEYIRKAAVEELEAERYRELVEQEKERIRQRRRLPWWKKLFPYRIVILKENTHE